MSDTASHALPAILTIRNTASQATGLRWTAYLFLILLAAAFFIPGIASLPPVDRDETSFAQASKQMIETGNYVDIRVQEKPRYKKPIGIYWLQAASVRLFNPNHLAEIWAYRLPSLAGAIAAVALTAALGDLLFGPTAGFLAGILLASCILLNVEARLAKTDAVLLATIMAAQLALAKAWLARTPRPNANALLFWTALGAGILIKGPIILLVVISTLLWLRFTHKDMSRLKSLRPWLGIPYVLLLTAPWFIAILMQSHGQFLHDSAGQDLLAKIWQGQNRGKLPPGLHLLVSPFVFFPSSLFMFLGITDIWNERRQPAIAFCIGWIVPIWIIFELSLTKLPHYVMPAYPAIAILAAKAFTDGYPHLLNQRSRWYLALVALLWFIVGAVIAAGTTLLPQLLDHAWILPQAIACALMLMIQGYVLILVAQRKTRSVPIMAVAGLIFISITFSITLPSIQHLWVTREVYIDALLSQPCKQLDIVSASYDEPSLVFMAGTRTRLLTDAAAAASDLHQDPCALALIDAEHKAAFLSAYAAPAPQLLDEVKGYNIGHGNNADLFLYRAPQR